PVRPRPPARAPAAAAHARDPAWAGLSRARRSLARAERRARTLRDDDDRVNLFWQAAEKGPSASLARPPSIWTFLSSLGATSPAIWRERQHGLPRDCGDRAR